MPRLPRQRSESGIYHIILRGINQQVIFEDNEDYDKFIEILDKYKKVSEYKLFAYCLMTNHIHILLKEEKETVDTIIKRVATSYVYWYNWKYYRKGTLFQDRFKSEPVENDAYFLTVLRYIHQNPIKAKVVKNINEYKYSSYNDYIHCESSLIDIDFAYSMLSKEQFVKFNNEINNDICMEINEPKFRLSDNDAKTKIKKITNCDNVSEFQALETEKRDKFIKKLKQEGLSIRQISRLTGISKGIVERI